MNTLKRRVAMHAAAVPPAARLPNPACVPGAGRRCEHALVAPTLNGRLSAYERLVRGRFEAIVPMLQALSAMQHEADFVAQAQQIAQAQLGFALPASLLDHAWVAGLDLRQLYTHCVFRTFKVCVDSVEADQRPWREHQSITSEFLLRCGLHTVDISPCADGRLQGLLPFVLRMTPHAGVTVKAYAGALFDVEADVADWTRRELERLGGGLPGAEDADYLKMAVYHFSSSNPQHQGCAAHGSHDDRARQAAVHRLAELRAAVDNTFGAGAAPQVLLIGVDTDTDAIRVHVSTDDAQAEPGAFIDSAQIFRDTLAMSADDAREAIAVAVARAERGAGLHAGVRRLVQQLLEANLSQIEYVIRYHDGRYADIGHAERFICAGEAMSELQLRNQFYFAHLDTVEEGAPDLDVGMRIFGELNVARGLPVPVLVHFHFESQVPGARERAVARCRRVKAAIESRYQALHAQGLLHCQMAVSDACGSERGTFIDPPARPAGH